jgi:hypothetical protein
MPCVDQHNGALYTNPNCLRVGFKRGTDRAHVLVEFYEVLMVKVERTSNSVIGATMTVLLYRQPFASNCFRHSFTTSSTVASVYGHDHWDHRFGFSCTRNRSANRADDRAHQVLVEKGE